MSNLSLNYLIKSPKETTSKTPLLLLLHGYGSNEADLFSFASELPEDYLIISAQAPQSMGFGQYAWYAIHFDAADGKFSDIPQALEARDTIAKFIDELKSKYTFDSNNVTLLGFSQGAILSYSLAFNYPEKVQKIIALSGYINEELNTKTALETSKKIPFFVSHGTQDQVLPVALARKTVEYLKANNYAVTYQEYPIGHGVSPQNFTDFKAWLAKHK
jgi:phospholipase/carboxylesterase